MPTATTKTEVPEKGEVGKVEGGNPPLPPDQHDHLHSRSGNKVFKSGPLFLSSKGIGWTSWKKRWFILTRTSLVFFRSDPSAAPQKGSEVNLTLGGIDLNNSGSVVVKADKKLLTVLFPDGRDGRAFTLKAETLEDLYEWKAALEEALEQAPSASIVMGQNGTINKDENEAVDGSKEQAKDRPPPKSMVIGRPVLLALEDIDGTPSFLEKGLQFLEQYGVKVEGILRQAADVDDVNHRIQEYEQGKTEFSPQEDAHVIADCIKYILRELPSSPVPASCCKALLEACRTERGRRVAAMREAICETFPEPNRRLLQRILTMMQTIASHKADNRMSTSAVAACMAPLLLRPLLNGECELEHDFDVGGDGSLQLLQAAAAANHAQAIVITLLEEYESIFGEGELMSELYSESDEYGTESEELTDDEEFTEDDEYEDEEEDSEVDDDPEHASDASYSDTGDSQEDEDVHGLPSKSSRSDDDSKNNHKLPSSSPKSSISQQDTEQRSDNSPKHRDNISAKQANKSGELLGSNLTATNSEQKSSDRSPASNIQETSDGSVTVGRRAAWGRAPAKKNLPTESVDFTSEEEAEIEKLEKMKVDLQNQLAEEVKQNAALKSSLERRKNALRERRVALERDVARLQEQLKKETELTTVLEAGLYMAQGSMPISSSIDEKTKVELAEIAKVEVDVMTLKQKADDLQSQLNQQSEKNSALSSRSQTQQAANNPADSKAKDEDGSAANARSIDRSTTKQDNSESPGFVVSSQPETIYSAARKLTARNEGANATSSALAKLTNRLNFLKERRNQMANEDRVTTSSAPESGKGSESQQPDQNPDNSDKSHSVQNVDNKGTPEGQSAPNQKEKSEASSTTDKGRKSDVPPKTSSR